jgi:excinuclease ABC subunit C
VPVDFEDRELLEVILAEHSGHRVEILTPQRGPKRALLQLVAKNAQYSFDRRFRVMKPAAKDISEALQATLNLPQPPRRIESFDVSHLHGAETVASMVVCETGKMKKSDYRKFIIRQAARNDDFASMHEAVLRRYDRLLAEKRAFPDLILVDGGLGQLHAANQALEDLHVINQPLASIAKKEETLYVLGQEGEPIHLERHSPVLHLVQMIRDETHRFAVTFHRQRRSRRGMRSELLDVPGIGEQTAVKLLRTFGSLDGILRASPEDLLRVINRRQAEKLREFLSPLVPRPASNISKHGRR